MVHRGEETNLLMQNKTQSMILYSQNPRMAINQKKNDQCNKNDKNQQIQWRKVPTNATSNNKNLQRRQQPTVLYFILHTFYTKIGRTYTLSGLTGSVLAWHSEGSMFEALWVQQVLWFATRISLCNTWSSGGTALCRVGGATSQLDLPSLTPFSVAGCGRLQLGAPHWATSVNYCK